MDQKSNNTTIERENVKINVKTSNIADAVVVNHAKSKFR
jgi:hypothetical protein